MSGTIGPMFLGALFVVIGVLAAAAADRIRGVRWTKERAPRERETSPDTRLQGARGIRVVHDTNPRKGQAPVTDAHRAMRGEVISALVQAGFAKSEATQAVDACPSAAQGTLESWTRAALRATSATKENAA